MSNDELEDFFYGCGWTPYFVSGSNSLKLHEDMAKTMDKVFKDIEKVRKTGKGNYPMIVLTTPKGWTGPKEVDNKKIEGTFRAHQVPIAITKEHPENLDLLEKWLKSYKVDLLFDEKGKLIKELKSLCPPLTKCMGSSSYANGGLLLKEINTPDWEDYALDIKKPGAIIAQDTMELGNYIRDVFTLNKDNKNFRIFGPDEALSNRFNHIFEVENRMWNYKMLKSDEFLANDGRVMDSYLSEHLCEGMLEGYLLTGRYGFLHSYEAFARIIDSMASQHAKWLKVCNQIEWRAPIASLNFLLVSHVFQQDHNGYTHQDPGFLNHLVTKKADVVRMYLPPDTNCLLSCFEHCIKSKNYVNVIVASKHPRPQWLTKTQARVHCRKGLGVWNFASNDEGNPDVVLACCGETPTLEVLAAVDILRRSVKGIKIRVVNVVDLMKLQSNSEHPHGMTDEEYDEIFTKNKPIIFNFHGYPSLIHQLTYRRTNRNLHVHGYKEEGTITTTFDIRVQNEIDRFHIVMAVLQEIPRYKKTSQVLIDWCNDMLKKHKEYISEYGIDMPLVRNWKWDSSKFDK
jgi:xylulose-5-phosphate/fructose-6-phosphate phosphoketolase